jgi:ATP/maltotriose-dependent transcriptional regulator MalT/DNA-binding SARP family transcriptional activator
MRRLDGIPSHRLTTVIGGAGFGKSTALAAWVRPRSAAWYTLDPADRRLTTLTSGLISAVRSVRPDAADALGSVLLHGQGNEDDSDEIERARSIAAVVSDVLAEHGGDDCVLVFDDFDKIEGAPAAIKLIESLVRLAPVDLHVVLASRRPVPFAVDRLRGQGQLLEIDDELLAFSIEEVRTLLGRIIGAEGAEVAGVVHASTDGWPAAVVLAAQTLHDTPASRRSAALRRLQRPEGPLFAYIAREALAHESAETIAWLRIAAQFERFSADLLEAVGLKAAQADLAHGGRPSVFLQHVSDEPGWYRLHGLVREYIVSQLPVPEQELREIDLRAGAWFEAHGMVDEALQAFASAGDATSVGRLLRDRGSVLLQEGNVDRIVSAEASLSDDLRGPGSERLYGDALLTQGDWAGALAAFGRAGGAGERLESGLAWRIGLIHYLRGDLEQASATFERARLDGAAPSDDALVLAWSSSVSWVRGEAERSRAAAERALEIARLTGDDRALAAAHVAQALVAILDGDRRRCEQEYRTARHHAERAGDVLQLIRVTDNLGDHLFEQGRYADALHELDAAVRLAAAVGFPSYEALALADRGQAQLELGHFDEAFSDFRASRTIYQRLESGWFGYAIVREAWVHMLRGDLALARAAYEDAIGIADRTGDRQILVRSLVGLALTIVGDQPDRARELVARALEDGHGVPTLLARVGAARVALALGERDSAIRHANDAIAAGWEQGDRPHVARALEARAVATASEDIGAALRDLDQANTIWMDCGSPTGQAWNTLARAQVVSGDERVAAARDAEARFVALGARGPASEARTIGRLAEARSRPRIAIESLGAFRVLRDGRPVAVAEWQSKKARDLLKMLVARRGRPVPRESLIEALWPDQDPGPLGNRFSVALTTVRTVLDPERESPADHFLIADKNTVALDVDHIELDLVRFLSEVEAGRRLERAGRTSEAIDRFRAAAGLYGGDFLAEDPFEEWSIALRDEAQAAYLSVIRILATASAADGDDAAATGFFLRILERDPYDETAHLRLVEVLLGAGRHGEARRRYGVYQARMEEIGVEATPFQSPVSV